MIDVSGESFPGLLKRTVLLPLGMSNSGFLHPLPADLDPRAAVGYRSSGEMVKGRYHTYPELAAAGLWTTPYDLSLFTIELMKASAGTSNKVLPQEIVNTMLTPVQDSYGLGMAIRGEGEWIYFGHNGSNEGYRCNLVAYPEQGMGAAIMTNSDSGSDLAREILGSIAAEYGWPDYEPREIEQAELSEKELAAIQGQYSVPDTFQFKIRQEDSLSLEIKDGPKWRIVPVARDRVLILNNETEIRFGFGPDGKAATALFSFGSQDYRAVRK
jgi:hypothetical protein